MTTLAPARRGALHGPRPVWLRHRADRWSLAVVGAVFLLQLALFFLMRDLRLVALGVLALLPVQTVTIACTHNHHHQAAFTAGWLNHLYELVLFLETGLPPGLLTLHHNIGHHHHYLTPQNDTLRWRRKNGEPMGFVEYVGVNFAGVFTHTIALGRTYPNGPSLQPADLQLRLPHRPPHQARAALVGAAPVPRPDSRSDPGAALAGRGGRAAEPQLAIERLPARGHL